MVNGQIRSNFAYVTRAQHQWYVQNYDIFQVIANQLILQDIDYES